MEGVGQIAIIGPGLLGTSLGLGLKAAGFGGRIVGVARRGETLAAAEAAGGIDAGTADVGEAVRDSELAVVAVPLGHFDAVLEQVGQADHAGLVVTDVGSTKLSVLASARRHLPEPGRFVGSHPMAGSEKQGPEGARADLCAGKPCVVTPEADTDAAALARVEAMWRMLGMSILRMSGTEHDEKTATISHLPHLMAVLLVEVAMERGGWEVASTGFRDTTRLASSNPPMRADIVEANREQVLGALAAMRGQIDRVMGLLEEGDREGVLKVLEEAKARRDAWVQGED